jgi:hypothetical protein
MSENQVIPDEAVEAALVGLIAAFESGYIDADDTSDVLIDIAGFDLASAVRAALEAAAPHILAEAKADAYEEGFEVAGDLSPAFNPYRTTK